MTRSPPCTLLQHADAVHPRGPERSSPDSQPGLGAARADCSLSRTKIVARNQKQLQAGLLFVLGDTRALSFPGDEMRKDLHSPVEGSISLTVNCMQAPSLPMVMLPASRPSSA